MSLESYFPFERKIIGGMEEIKKRGEKEYPPKNELQILIEQSKFLIKERRFFMSNYQGGVSDQIIRKFDYEINNVESLIQREQNKSKTPTDDPIPDYSGNPYAERIVFLKDLGILDFLQNKMLNELHNFSAHKLSEILSTFTGIPAPTIQSYVNPIYSKDVDQSKSPCTPKNKDKVKHKLIKIGFC